MGAGVSVDNVIVRGKYSCPLFALGNIPGPNGTGIGGTLFDGQTVAIANDFSLAVEASYKFVPSTGLSNLSQFRFGLRANL